VHDEVDRCRKFGIGAGVVEVRMGVDDRGDRLVGHRLDLLENHFAPVGELRVDDHHAALGDEDSGIAAAEFRLVARVAAADDVEIIVKLSHLGDGDRTRLRRLTRCSGNGQAAHNQHRTQAQFSWIHVSILIWKQRNFCKP
jgi:hypothetical protein